MARILVVDDDPDARRLVERILAGAGHEVASEEDGGRAVDAVRREQPELVILDLHLPGMDGFAVCRALKDDAALAEIPVVMCTAEYDTVDDAQRGLDLGAVEYVVKPFAPQVLLYNVQRLLERRVRK